MSKTAEEHIAELKATLKRRDDDMTQLRGNYNKVYQHMQEAEKTAMYYKGQVESGGGQYAESTSTPSMEEMEETATDYGGVDANNPEQVVGALEEVIRSRLEPRLQQIEQYATDALQQTAGREVDRALKDFKTENPESSSIMDFERLVLLDASDEVRRRQATGQPIDDIKQIALESAKKRIGTYNEMQKSVTEENAKRREEAKRKAMLPDFMAAAGFEEAPDAPSNVDEAGELLDKILSSEQQKAALGLR
jgi:hypothetical protein